MIAQSSLKSSKSWNLRGRVLIVEDDPVMGPWLTKKLEKAGLEPHWVAEASAALEALSSKQFHAVISDVFLEEGMSEGMQVIKKVKELDIPVIVITAKADLEVARGCLKESVYQFLEKPLDIDDLLQSLSNAWENPRCLSTIVERFLETHGLTETERKVARLVLKGLSNKEVAQIVGNTEKTIKFHMTVIYSKCGVSSRGEFFNAAIPT